MDQKIDIDIKEIYKLMCPKCREKLKDLIKKKLTDRMVEAALEEKDK